MGKAPKTVLQILVVEDNADYRQALSIIIHGKLGANVLTAGDGIEALAILRTSRVDVVLTDVEMPRMDGRQLVREIGKLQTKIAQIFMMSGGSCTAEEARALGADSFFQKPIDIKVLIKAIIQYFRF